MSRLARAVALSRSGRTEEAEAERAAAGATLAAVPDEAVEGFNPVSALGGIAMAIVDGELARAVGDYPRAVAALEKGVTLEDGLRYNEPSDWYFPVRHVLGATLLEAGRPADAEKVFRRDLEINAENGWALTGLVAALRRQGREREAAAIDRRLAIAWARADLELDKLAAPADRSARSPAASVAGSTRR
ncbi:MAG: hypothetical protein R2862_08360 [Thermoanaerobaculia bacterium]